MSDYKFENSNLPFVKLSDILSKHTAKISGHSDVNKIGKFYIPEITEWTDYTFPVDPKDPKPPAPEDNPIAVFRMGNWYFKSYHIESVTIHNHTDDDLSHEYFEVIQKKIKDKPQNHELIRFFVKVENFYEILTLNTIFIGAVKKGIPSIDINQCPNEFKKRFTHIENLLDYKVPKSTEITTNVFFWYMPTLTFFSLTLEEHKTLPSYGICVNFNMGMFTALYDYPCSDASAIYSIHKAFCGGTTEQVGLKYAT